MSKDLSKLDALLSKSEETKKSIGKSDIVGSRVIQILPVKELHPDPDNARFGITENDEEIQELASSIRNRGLLQPLVVKEQEEGGYKVIIGHRRLAALKLLNYEHVECKIFPKEITEDEIREMQLIENIQRKDLSPMEEARAYERYLQKTGTTQRELARKIGISEENISRAMKLLKLPKERQEKIESLKLKGRLLRKAISIRDDADFETFIQMLQTEKEEILKEKREELDSSKEKNLTPRQVSNSFQGDSESEEEIDFDKLGDILSMMAIKIQTKKQEVQSFLSTLRKSEKQTFIQVCKMWDTSQK